ncbi:uncharacterized protein LOC122353979 isoform X3 [Puntigrus tetrazona]|uniref:uncharacterized protein LOC122353979 isoform X3 n=1 Tax=Puntigrus tetrazona TaxID=1606681 RepID=UPI001C8AF2F2|nr:uncharacterized protein LOC122353979 isoform X3 [Puntigrus tetrazona]
MEWIVFIVFQLLTEVQSYKSPTVRVSPDVIRESSSVKISCETPGDVPVNQCYYYTNREERNIKTSWRCELDLTGAELIRWAAVTSHGLINIYCYYTPVNDTSSSLPHSPHATVKVIVSPSTTTEQTSTTAMKTSLLVMSTSETTTHPTTDPHSNPKLSTSLTKETTISITNSTLSGNSRISEHTTTAIDFISGSTRTAVSNVHTSTAHPTDPHTATTAIDFISGSTRTAVSNVHTSTAHPTNQHTDTGTWFVVYVSTAVAVVFFGLTVCLCWFASKKRRKQLNTMEVPNHGIGMSNSGTAEIYSLITSVPETSQPISEGLEHPESHQDSTADPTDTNSFVMSVNAIYQPSDVLANKQQKQGNPEDNENVYHLYSTILDKPVRAEDHVYSLLNMNQ